MVWQLYTENKLLDEIDIDSLIADFALEIKGENFRLSSIYMYLLVAFILAYIKKNYTKNTHQITFSWSIYIPANWSLRTKK